jgi:hypothetical protein
LDHLESQIGTSGFYNFIFRFDFFLLPWSLDVLLPLSMLQIILDLQIFMFSFFFDLILKLSKSDCPKPETEPSRISSLAKFRHQQNIVRIVALPGSNDFQVFPNTAPPFKATLKLLKFYFIFWNYK